MNSGEDKKLKLLETLANNQKHMIELLSILNSNVEELIVDVKDIKKSQSFNASLCIEGSSSSSSSNDICKNNKQTTLLNLNSQQTQTATTNHHQSGIQVQSAQSSLINMGHMNHHAASANQDALGQMQNVDIEPNMQTFRNSSNFIDANVNTTRIDALLQNQDNYKPVKTGLREFSTFVSKMVRQEFGYNFLALTRINELDRYVMQKIRDEAISKYLPEGVSPQFAWNHAMNSLRQLRHRQCKKAKITL